MIASTTAFQHIGERNPRLTNLLPFAIVVTTLAVAIGCESSSKPDSKPASPAKVEKLPQETELATVTLTTDAVTRLGITIVEVAEQQVSRYRTLAGEAMVPIGNTVVVTAPVPGLVATHQAKIPAPGANVAAGTILLDLVPLLSPERDVMTPAERVQLVGARATLMAAETTAQGDVDRSQAEVDGAQIAVDRATKLFEDRAGSRKAVDDATALLNIAKSNLAAASQRQQQLARLIDQLQPQDASGNAMPLPLTAPIAGMLSRVSVSEGQTVAVGAALFEVANLDTIWIRVPVFVDMLDSIDRERDAQLVSLGGGQTDTPGVAAKPIAAPPSADALSSSADFYYEVDNQSLGLRPGQRIGVELPLVGNTEALVVPAAAVLYDIYGGTWVYTLTGERQYTRSRVSLGWVDGDTAVLAGGLSAGTPVVVDGAAELFGTEFGTGK